MSQTIYGKNQGDPGSVEDLIRSSQRLMMSAVEKEFVDNCTIFEEPSQRLERARLFLNDAIHGR